MRRLRRLRLLFIMLCMFTLTGCIQKYGATEELGDATAEYMAGLLLKYDENYKQDLSPKGMIATETEKLEKTTDVPTPTISPIKDSATSTESETDETQKEYTLTEVIGEKNFDIEYTDYEVADTYPEDTDSTYFSLTPREGNQLIVVSFIVKNKTDKEKTLNLSKLKILYQLEVNKGTVYKPSLTLLENDLQYIDIKVASGKSEPVLLIFEASKENDMSNIKLLISKDDKSEIIEIK
jgi:hypothetical protein